ncbi:FAD-binding oxidoreductase [Chitinophaga oryzae]|uniref:D-lactate dehydrogenase (cytochrome) n=1 Tax=Chitinophaga oryzae TaxID=2725414 RepID=A0AAE6ZI51_9BACT|nr:FAD-binding and (Fe-S)-binding domain-containing protein [Chitinophaga oryzae]QJB33071.1 FAD-binding oxidoreductase [Chitinophaga oryzae]QJB39545.1 FAD-binding oxidoreductase [Chitinophaga oryzae]
MNIAHELKKILPENRIKSRYIDLISYASDAGFYHLVPQAVVQPIGEAEIVALFRFSQQYRIPLVFRTGGTSLSGQSITDGILVDLSQYWNKIQIEEKGLAVRVQPGITGAMVNTYLKKHARKIGPDPSSINSAMMGGILSNNSSGMCCGVALNSYHTTRYIRFILPDGNTFSTEHKKDYARFEMECAPLFVSLADCRDLIAADRALHDRIRHKYQTKNTVGYALNAFIDYHHPLDIMAHLLIGAEGTLAFIAEAVMDTVPDYAYKSTALLYFPTIYAACQAIVPLTNAGALMVELMDRASLHAVEDMDGMPAIVKTLPETAAALLIEFQEESQAALDARVNGFMASAASLDMSEPPVFTIDPAEQAFFWKIRKGLFPAVGAVRASGTTVILEDIAFPVDKLGDAILDLQKLFAQYNYLNAIIFGHAKDGNIHFVVTQSFNTPDEVTRYELFMQDVVALVVNKYDGTLKAEHGTGRNMAPFVETEWGGDAYDIMKKIKEAADPHNLLNPGVIINPDARAHLRHLKELPTVEEEVDRCIECGYCEHKCPSRDITTTPRRRIVIRRALKQLQKNGDKANYKVLLDQYQYDVLETCAVDGLCATACPVDINTGDLVKRLRRENHSPSANKLALQVAKHFRTVEWAARTAIRVGTGINRVFGKHAMTSITKGIRSIIPAVPLWSEQLQPAPDLGILKPQQSADASIVYFPACISRMLGTYEGKSKNLMETFMSVCRKAGISVVVPDNLSGTCCSQIFSSKGYKDAYEHTANHIIEKLWHDSRQGALPVVIDVSSCAYTLHHVRPALNAANKEKFDQLRILDAVDFLHDFVLPKVTAVNKKKSIALHPVCSLEKMKTGPKFVKVAQFFAEEVVVPKYAGCCGMAGDRGFLFPELTASATRPESLEVKCNEHDGYYSSTKTCEIAMSAAVKKNYESVLYLVDEGL